MISFGHGMFFGLGAYGFGLIMQRTGVPVPVAFVATLRDHRRCRRRHRRDLRAAEGNLFRLRDAGVPDADPQHDPVLGVADRRRPGPARRHSAPGLLRHRSVEPRASVHRELRAAGDRAAPDAPDRAIAVRLYLAHDPRQRRPRQLHRHRRLARQADDLRAGGAVRLDRRHHHGAVRLRRLSGIRLLDDLGRGHLHQHARRRDDIPRADGRHRAAADPQRHRYPADRLSRHRARHRDPVLRHRPAQRPDGFCRRMVRATPRRRRGSAASHAGDTRRFPNRSAASRRPTMSRSILPTVRSPP